MPTIYAVELPSGATGHVVMTITAGEAIISIVLLMLVAVVLFRELRDVAWFASKR
jgi:hypothetical protein